jgi:hypothetical protein
MSRRVLLKARFLEVFQADVARKTEFQEQPAAYSDALLRLRTE